MQVSRWGGPARGGRMLKGGQELHARWAQHGGGGWQRSQHGQLGAAWKWRAAEEGRGQQHPASRLALACGYAEADVVGGVGDATGPPVALGAGHAGGAVSAAHRARGAPCDAGAVGVDHRPQRGVAALLCSSRPQGSLRQWGSMSDAAWAAQEQEQGTGQHTSTPHRERGGEQGIGASQSHARSRQHW